MNYKYPLICFEGLDASGKATMSAYAAELLKGVVFSFPRYDTPTGPTGSYTTPLDATADARLCA